MSTPNMQDTDHGHYWVGCEHGNNGKWSIRVGPSYPDIIWDFFSRNSRDGTDPGGFPVITLIGDNPMTVNINTTTKNRTVNVVDPNAPIETCEQATASPNAHISAGRAYAGGSYDLRALTSGDGVDIGGSFDTWSSVTLHEGEPGLWYASEPAACNGSGDGGDGGNDGGGEFACQDWNDSNLNHDVAGRAYYAGGYFTTGGDDTLGALSGTYTWVKETSDGFFEAGACN